MRSRGRSRTHSGLHWSPERQASAALDAIFYSLELFKGKQMEPEAVQQETTKFRQQKWAFVFGIVFLTLLLIMSAVLDRSFNPLFLFTFRIALGLAAAGVAAMIPGSIDYEVSNVIKAGGAIAVFVFVVLLNPGTDLLREPESADYRKIKSIAISDLNYSNHNFGIFLGNFDPEKVRRNALKKSIKSAKLLEGTDDSDLTIRQEIYKYKNVIMAWMIAASLERTKEKKLEFIKSGLNQVNHIETLFEINDREAREWVIENHIQDEIKIYQMVLVAIRLRVQEEKDSSEYQKIRDSISDSVLQDYDYTLHPSIRYVETIPSGDRDEANS